MSVNKVDVNGETLIDLTADTVSPSTLYKGRKAHTANGAIITGEMDLNDMLAEGQTILSSYQMGDTLPDAGTPGRVFFKAGGIDYSDVISLIYPVGSIYTSVNATNPSILFGGTWEAIGGRFLIGGNVAPGLNTSNYYGTITENSPFTPGTTGGQDYHVLTANEMPVHSHRILQANNATGTTGTWVTNAGTSNSLKVAYSGSKTSNNVIETTGGGARHNNMPPYMVVYMWKRTA